MSELCCTIWPVTQSAPGLRDLLGDGDGLGDLDGDGLGERDLDGLGLVLVLADGLELELADGLELWLGLCDVLLLGLGLVDELVLLDALLLGLVEELVLLEALVLLDGLELCDEVAASRFADSTATELCPHGDAIGRCDEARAGAIVKPEARNDPAARQTAMRPARMIPTGTGALRSSG
ncbi:MAG: hypothetical protein ACTHJW_10800 [Streptosporangiaceae bacterium]